jgi:hypothetical protein
MLSYLPPLVQELEGIKGKDIVLDPLSELKAKIQKPDHDLLPSGF